MTRKRQRRFFPLLAAVLAAAVLAGCGSAASGQSGAFVAQSAPAATPEPTPTPNPGLSWPYVVEDGNLQVDSLFQYSGINPDCDGEMGDDIAALQVTNLSDRFVELAELTATLLDGTGLNFVITNVPAGQTVLAFAVDNAAYPDMTVLCDTVTCSAVYGDAAPVMADTIAVDVQETTVTLTNMGSTDLTNLAVGCHCLFDGAYFGGVTYNYAVDCITAGSSVTIQADDCYLGQADVVCIQSDPAA